jgi:hypothetical protein
MAILLAAVPLIVAAGPPPAAPVEERAVTTGKVKLDPQRGYIFLHAPMRFNGMFLKVPDDADREQYQNDWEEGLAKAQKRYLGEIGRWEASARIARQTKAPVPAKPIEPNRENFSIDPIELRGAVSFGPMYVFNKSDQRFSYLTAVRPGTYAWYGSVMVLPESGAGGTCTCMGTVKFEVRPGAVTNLGNFLQAAPESDHHNDVLTMEAWQRVEDKAAKSGKPVEPGFLAKPALDFTLPGSLSAWPSAQAEFSANGKLNNFYGVLVSRLPAIPGILAYRRDIVIDARTNIELVSAPIVSRQRPKR